MNDPQLYEAPASWWTRLTQAMLREPAVTLLEKNVDDRAGDARAAADAGCTALWASIRERADQAARLNRTNGVLIGIRLEHNQRMLNFIEEAAGKGLYGPDGQARAAGGHVSSRV